MGEAQAASGWEGVSGLTVLGNTALVTGKVWWQESTVRKLLLPSMLFPSRRLFLHRHAERCVSMVTLDPTRLAISIGLIC